MIPRTFLLAAAAVALAGPACATQPPSPRGDWVLVGLNGAAPPARVSATLRLENGRLSGRAFCNSFGGAYQVRSARLLVGQVSTTRMLCEGRVDGFDVASGERTFLDVLGAKPRLQLGSEGLFLQAENGATLQFRRTRPR